MNSRCEVLFADAMKPRMNCEHCNRSGAQRQYISPIQEQVAVSNVLKQEEPNMNNVIYLIGLIVVVLAILSFLGFS
jgi:hypothetical protein